MRLLTLVGHLPLILALAGCVPASENDVGKPVSSAPLPTADQAISSSSLVPTTLPPSATSTTTERDVPAAERAATVASSAAATGVVIAVDGDLTEVRGFSLLLGDGSTLGLATEPGLLFADGPLSHVRDHMVSGSPIRVTYTQAGDTAIVTAIGDAE